MQAHEDFSLSEVFWLNSVFIGINPNIKEEIAQKLSVTEIPLTPVNKRDIKTTRYIEP